MALQAVTALVLLKLPGTRGWLDGANAVVQGIGEATSQAASFLFGYLAGGPLPFSETSPGSAFIVAFRVLPLVVVMSAVSALLFYWRILPAVGRGFAWVLRRTLGLSGPTGVAAATDVFLGIAEAPLFVKPYLKAMGRGGDAASLARLIDLVLYATVLAPVLPDAAGHVLVASFIARPGAVAVAHLLFPDGLGRDAPVPEVGRGAESTMDAIARGAMDGIQMLFAIVAMILVLFALVNLVNLSLAAFGNWGGERVTLQRILAYGLRPFLWLVAIPAAELDVASRVFATKVLLNEFVAFLELARTGAEGLSSRSRVILTYAMCGFANVASMGILVGSLTTLAPELRREVLSLGWWSLLAGNVATGLSGAVVGLFY